MTMKAAAEPRTLDLSRRAHQLINEYYNAATMFSFVEDPHRLAKAFDALDKYITELENRTTRTVVISIKVGP